MTTPGQQPETREAAPGQYVAAAKNVISQQGTAPGQQQQQQATDTNATYYIRTSELLPDAYAYSVLYLTYIHA